MRVSRGQNNVSGLTHLLTPGFLRNTEEYRRKPWYPSRNLEKSRDPAGYRSFLRDLFLWEGDSGGPRRISQELARFCGTPHLVGLINTKITARYRGIPEKSASSRALANARFRNHARSRGIPQDLEENLGIPRETSRNLEILRDAARSRVVPKSRIR